MNRAWMMVIPLLSFLGGCVPTKEAKTAGQIGCTPEEITISNADSHFGTVQSGATWVAECQGHTFVCSQINQSGKDKSFLDAMLASEQVTCHEAPESLEAERNRRGREVASVERANRPPSKAPTGAAGFAFGETQEEVAHHCEAAGQTWRSDTRACSGPAAPLGIPANVAVEFCEGRVCSIALEHFPHANWSRASVSLKANLESKYGAAQRSDGSVPAQCRSERAFTRCLQSRRVSLRYVWQWAGGESIEMNVGKRNETDLAAIRLFYRRPADSANLSAL
ncbi:MAG TPA: hypothetical protein VFQ61_03175 [Polyangiaceae bacterium]|nr:hypothetical protein [Polyangiaceae bacterium]